MEIGRMCVKLAGRDAGLKCVVVDEAEDGRVLIDGQTRRREVNPKHLKMLNQTVDIKKGASHSQVKKVFGDMNIGVRDTEPKESGPRPKKSKVVKEEQDYEEPAEETDEAGEETTEEREEQEVPSRSTVENMTKDEIKEFASDFGVELSTNDLKKEMIDQFFEEVED